MATFATVRTGGKAASEVAARVMLGDRSERVTGGQTRLFELPFRVRNVGNDSVEIVNTSGRVLRVGGQSLDRGGSLRVPQNTTLNVS